MEKINANGQIIGGAAELKNLILGARAKSSVWYSINFNYSHYSISLANGDGCWSLNVYDDDVKEVIPENPNILRFLWGTYQSKKINPEYYGFYLGRKWCGSLVDRAVEAIINIIGKYEADLEWEKLMDESEYIENEKAILESEIDDANSDITDAIEKTKDIIDDIVDVDWWELDDDGIKNEITENCSHIAFALNELAQARENFLTRLSDYTGCDFCFGDAYSDEPVVDIYPYYSEISDFDCTQAFDDILAYLFDAPAKKYGENSGTCENLLSLRDTLFHYLMVA